ncbi:MAG: FadR family transcriptional regulator [Sinobacteraceae bacterium]|nr:FadR family transcriptional regulator [Nevskiaceae bacterium]
MDQMANKKISDSGRRSGGAVAGGRLYKRVADELRAAILAGRYSPGGRLPAERELGDMFNVSRPTVREAVIALELQGLVEVRVGAGVFVLEPSAAERVRGGGPELTIGPFELMEARKIIESETAALAATLIDDEQLERLDRIIDHMEEENRRDIQGESADRQFHVAIAECTGNSALVSVIDDLWEIRETSPMVINLMEKARSKGVKPIVDEHRGIVAALRKRDPVAARTAMQDHITHTMEELLQATETEAMQRIQTEIAARRKRFRRPS